MPRIALCSFSYGIADGIARMDQLLVAGLRQEGYSVKHFVILASDIPDAPDENGIIFLNAENAYESLLEEFASTDIVFFNGSVDCCVTFAAADARVPVVAEILHVPEQGGMYPDTDCIISVSDNVARRQKHPRCRTVLNAIALERFSFKAGRRKPEGALFLQIANRSKNLQFGIDELIPDILRLRSNTSFSAVGERPFIQHPALATYQAQEDISEFYHNADFNFLACPNDPFGLTLAEGMACGCLPIACANSGAAEFIEHGATGWLVHGGKENYIAAMLEAIDMLGSPAHAAMQERAREQIVRNYGRDQYINRYIGLIEELWNNSPARRERGQASGWRHLSRAMFQYSHCPDAAMASLEKFASGNTPLDPSLLGHPTGQAIVGTALKALMLTLKRDHNYAPLVRKICALLRASRIKSDILDVLEVKTKK